jgi:glucose-6-phosphate isomerase
MQLPDEVIEYDYRRLLVGSVEPWTPLVELQAQNYLTPERIDSVKRVVEQVRGMVSGERELHNPPPRLQPLQPGFIDLPQKLLDQFRRKGDASELGKINRIAARVRESCDRVVVLGIGGSYLGAKALFDALCHAYHNELPAKMRMGKPRMYFEGNNLDNDALADLLELFENTCVDPDLPEERWGAVVVSKSGGTLETAAAFRAVRAEAARFYGAKSQELKDLIVPVTGPKGKLRDLARAEGYSDDEILTIPDDIGGRFSVLTAVGLLPAAILGLDVRALLLGAAAMTKRFLEEPFDRNPVLQYAAVNHLMNTDLKKPVRVLAVWSKKLESLGLWDDQLLAESLGKFGRGPTPVTAVYTRDLHSRGQQHQDGARDKVINNLYVKATRHPPIMIGMADRNEDDLNSISRRGFPDLMEAAFRGTNQASAEAARPTADLLLPGLHEHALGQLLQMLMLATVVEGRLANTNPYGQPGVEAYKRNMMEILRSTPNLPKGEVADAAKRA